MTVKRGQWRVVRGGRTGRRAFTLFEIVLILLVLGIAATMVVPATNNLTSPRLKTAAIVLAADLEFCQSECIAQPAAQRAIVFNITNNKYTMTVFSTGVAIKNPGDGLDFVNDFATGRNAQLNGVTISSIVMGSSGTLTTLTYDAYGKPLITGDLVITLSYKGQTMSVTLKSGTGDVSISG